MEQKFKIPTEFIDLPSKGLIYPLDNPLSSGVVEMSYMTARSEDILTNQNYIKNGTVLDKVIESLLVSKINLDDMIIGDKNALLIASRILGYGKDYAFTLTDGTEKVIDLTTLEDKELDIKELITERVNEFKYTLPYSENEVTYKLLTHGDEQKITKEIASYKKLFPEAASPELSTRMKYIITSINGEREVGTIREFIDKGMLAKDAKRLREEMKRVSPDVELIYKDSDEVEGIAIPITLNFFWPESTI